MKKGKLIVIEGGDFAGKSSLTEQLKQVYPDFFFSREPGNKLNTTHALMCEQLRDEIINKHNTPRRESQLFAASRYLHTLDIIDLINKGHNVIVERYILSSFAYQAYANKLGFMTVDNDNYSALNALSAEGIEINTIVLTINKETFNIRKRLRMQSSNLDVIEQRGEEFFDRVNNYFNDKNLYEMCSSNARFNFYNIDANNPKDQVLAAGINCINKIINNKK